MNESILRWEGRIGSLKGIAIIVLIFVVIFLVPTVDNLNVAWRNPSESQPVTVAQLAAGDVDVKQYVRVSGMASYELAYIESEDNVTTAIIYPLIDQSTNTVIFVRTTNTALETAADADVTISGLTKKADLDLNNAIEQDLPDITAAGFQTNSMLYIEEGKKPGQIGLYLAELAAIGVAGVLSI